MLLALFVVEFVLKVLVGGLSYYLRVAWNRLDAFIVFTSLLDIALSSHVNLAALKVLRALRPLRLVTLFMTCLHAQQTMWTGT